MYIKKLNSRILSKQVREIANGRLTRFGYYDDGEFYKDEALEFIIPIRNEEDLYLDLFTGRLYHFVDPWGERGHFEPYTMPEMEELYYDIENNTMAITFDSSTGLLQAVLGARNQIQSAQMDAVTGVISITRTV